MSAPTTDDVPQKLGNVRMFLTVFTVVQIVAAGVVVFSVNKMNLALVPHPRAADAFFGAAVLVLLLNVLFLKRALLLVRTAKAADPDLFARFTSEALLRTFLINVPTLILLVGYALTANQRLLVPAAVGLVAVWFTRPSRKQYDEWLAEIKVG
jgi:chromate transport protein ChrA